MELRETVDQLDPRYRSILLTNNSEDQSAALMVCSGFQGEAGVNGENGVPGVMVSLATRADELLNRSPSSNIQYATS